MNNPLHEKFLDLPNLETLTCEGGWIIVRSHRLRSLAMTSTHGGHYDRAGAMIIYHRLLAPHSATLVNVHIHGTVMTLCGWRANDVGGPLPDLVLPRLEKLHIGGLPCQISPFLGAIHGVSNVCTSIGLRLPEAGGVDLAISLTRHISSQLRAYMSTCIAHT